MQWLGAKGWWCVAGTLPGVVDELGTGRQVPAQGRRGGGSHDL